VFVEGVGGACAMAQWHNGQSKPDAMFERHARLQRNFEALQIICPLSSEALQRFIEALSNLTRPRCSVLAQPIPTAKIHVDEQCRPIHTHP